MAAYLSWMRNSQKGKDEDAAKNNHGTWYDLQVTELALFLGDRKLAVDTLERVKTRRITQIDPDGRQPLETARTNGWGYSNGNLDGLTQLATLGERVGVDLWNFKTPDGRSIRGAIDFLLPYAVPARSGSISRLEASRRATWSTPWSGPQPLTMTRICGRREADSRWRRPRYRHAGERLIVVGRL